MSSVVLDTNIVSYFLRRDTRREVYLPDVRGKRLCVSLATVAELRLGALANSWGTKRLDDLEHSLRGFLVLGFDDATAWQWARIADHERRAGRDRRYREDWWIAACALRHGMPLVTHNPRDFVGIPELQVITHAPDSSP